MISGIKFWDVRAERTGRNEMRERQNEEFQGEEERRWMDGWMEVMGMIKTV